jgi:hypothetical protein
MQFCDRVQIDIVIAQLLAEPGDILSVSGQAVERFADHHIGSTVLNQAQQLLEAWPVALIAGHLRVKECGYHRPA